MKTYFRTMVGIAVIFLLATTFSSKGVLANEIIKVGISDALSGPAAPWGIPKTQAMTIQIDILNAAGGVKIGDKTYTIKYVLEDDRGTAEGGATVANKLIFRDKVDFMLCVGTTPPALSMGPIAQENKMLIFINGTTGPGLSPKLSWVFRPHITAYERALASLAYMVKNKPEVKKVVLYGSDTEGGRFDVKTFKQLIEAKTKWQVVGEDYAPMGTKDYYPILSKFIAQKPDLMYTDSAPPGDVALIIKQSRELGYNGIILNNTTIDVGDIVKIAGVKSCENVFLPNYDRNMSEDMKRLTGAYYAKHKEHNDLVMFVADAVPIFIQALQGAKTTDKNAVKAYLQSGASYKSYMGPDGFFYGKDIVHYGIDNQFLAAVPIARIHEGKVDLISVVPPKDILELISPRRK